jgi:hypothetical protein
MSWFPAAAVACSVVGIVWWLRYGPVGPWLHAPWTARGRVPEECDDAYCTDPVDEQLETAPVDHFAAWESECNEDERIRKYARRMDKWSP